MYSSFNRTISLTQSQNAYLNKNCLHFPGITVGNKFELQVNVEKLVKTKNF